MTDVSDNVIDNVAEVKKPTTVVMSKKKYQEFKTRLTTLFDEDIDIIDKILKDLSEVLKFDPQDKIYTPEKGKKFIEWRKKRAEELGVSDYDYRRGIRKNKTT